MENLVPQTDDEARKVDQFIEDEAFIRNDTHWTERARAESDLRFEERHPLRTAIRDFFNDLWHGRNILPVSAMLVVGAMAAGIVTAAWM